MRPQIENAQPLRAVQNDQRTTSVGNERNERRGARHRSSTHAGVKYVGLASDGTLVLMPPINPVDARPLTMTTARARAPRREISFRKFEQHDSATDRSTIRRPNRSVRRVARLTGNESDGIHPDQMRFNSMNEIHSQFDFFCVVVID